MRSLLAAALLAAITAQPLSYKPFGTGLSQGSITQRETSIFAYTVSAGASHGVINHWWITGGGSTDNTIIRFYMDGEATASIQLSPAMACGVGFDDDSAVPWSTPWFGKGAKSGGWFSNFRLPFQRSVNVTFQAGPGEPNDVIYMIVRGAENLPIEVGGITLPSTAKMNLQITNATFQPLDFVPIVSAPAGTNGLFFMQTLAFTAANLNTLEGCYHAFTPASTPWPGLLMSTGTEDYYDSAYYFNAGQFHGYNAGFTHLGSAGSDVTFSAYRFHLTDPMVFVDGFTMLWRNGDVSDPATGLKCTLQTGGRTVGSPSAAQVLAYGWYYSW